MSSVPLFVRSIAIYKRDNTLSCLYTLLLAIRTLLRVRMRTEGVTSIELSTLSLARRIIYPCEGVTSMGLSLFRATELKLVTSWLRVSIYIDLYITVRWTKRTITTIF